MFKRGDTQFFSCSSNTTTSNPEAETMGKSVSNSYRRYGLMRDIGLVCSSFLLLLVVLGTSSHGAPAPNSNPGTPPRLPPLSDLQQSREVVRSLRANNFTIAAQMIQTYVPILPLNCTLFVPTNEAIASESAATSMLSLFLYHIARPQYNFDQLLHLRKDTRLVTALASESIVITNTSSRDYRVDDVRVVSRDVCSSEFGVLQISCHGVEAVLNATRFGTSIETSSPSPAPASMNPSPAPATSPPPAISPVPPPIASPLISVPQILTPPPAAEGVQTRAPGPAPARPAAATACGMRIHLWRLVFTLFLGTSTMSIAMSIIEL